MKTTILKAAILLCLGTSFVTATADGPDFLKPSNLEVGEIICIHKDHNISTPAIASIPATAKCIKNNSGYWPETGDAPPPAGTIVWVGVEYNGTKGWAMAKWLGEDTTCSTNESNKK